MCVAVRPMSWPRLFLNCLSCEIEEAKERNRAVVHNGSTIKRELSSPEHSFLKEDDVCIKKIPVNCPSETNMALQVG